MLRSAAALMVFLAMAQPSADAKIHPPAVSDLTVVYDLFFGGFRAGEMTIAAAFGPDGYRADADFRTTGIVGLFVDTQMRVETVGRVDESGLVPVFFKSEEREDEDEQYVEISFSEAGPSSVRAAPEFRIRPWSIEARDQRGVTDPLSAVLIALAPAPAEAVCDKRIEAFDGKRRFAFDLASPERDGDRIRCDGVYLRLAGFKPKTIRKRGRQPFKLYLEQRPDGRFQVVRLVGETEYGVAVMRLRD